MDGIQTGTVLAQVDSQNSEGNNPSSILFGPQSASTVSHTFPVFDVPVLLKAYGLTGSEVVTLQMVVQIGTAFFSEPVIINGHTVELDALNNNTLLIDLPGTYRCVLNSGLGTVAVTQQKTAMSYSSYGLRAFSRAG